ncbi:MAG: DUF3408 domain-containing protein [Flavobacteriaceae bacterium]|nr:DUF3408 domain-containing protein [Flavobacteriaceae bacterium]
MRNNRKKSYKDIYLQGTNFTAREGKTVYVREEYHKKLLQIVQTIGGNKVAISDLLDNILESHFSKNKKKINEEFEKNYKPIF